VGKQLSLIGSKKKNSFFSLITCGVSTLSLAPWKNVCWGGTIKGKQALIVLVGRRFSEKRVSRWPRNSCVVSDNKGLPRAYCHV